MRAKHFIPAYLQPSERKLIFRDKNKQLLADNPQTATIDDEEVPLVWLDRRHEIPARRELTEQAITLMSKGSPKDWQNLPNLLIGIKHCRGRKEIHPGVLEYSVRKAVAAGQLSILFRCLQQSRATGLSLKNQPNLTRMLVAGVHATASTASWSEEATSRALAEARQLSLLLETDAHGPGRTMKRDDPRRNPNIIGVFLSLAAAHAHLHSTPASAGTDKETVKAYVVRLLSTIGDQTQPRSWAPPKNGPVWEMLEGAPILHGLALAQRVLGAEGLAGDEARAAARIVEDYEAGLDNLAKALEAGEVKKGSHAEA